jgi:hypothetical protein
MKALVDVELLRIRLSLMDHPDVISALESLVSSAQAYFEEILDTKLLTLQNTDYFNLDTTVNRYCPNGFYRFKLRNSNVRKYPACVVTCSNSYEGVLLGTTTQLLDEAKGHYFIDDQKGYLYLNSESTSLIDGGSSNILNTYNNNRTLLPRYYKVVYSSGFSSITESPEWLKEAILTYAPLLGPQQDANTTKPAGSNGDDKRNALRLLDPYLRNIGMSISPIRTISQ